MLYKMKSQVFRTMMLCHCASSSSFEGSWCLPLQGLVVQEGPDDEGTTFLWNIRNHPLNDTTSYHRGLGVFSSTTV